MTKAESIEAAIATFVSCARRDFLASDIELSQREAFLVSIVVLDCNFLPDAVSQSGAHTVSEMVEELLRRIRESA